MEHGFKGSKKLGQQEKHDSATKATNFQQNSSSPNNEPANIMSKSQSSKNFRVKGQSRDRKCSQTFFIGSDDQINAIQAIEGEESDIQKQASKTTTEGFGAKRAQYRSAENNKFRSGSSHQSRQNLHTHHQSRHNLHTHHQSRQNLHTDQHGHVDHQYGMANNEHNSVNATNEETIYFDDQWKKNIQTQLRTLVNLKMHKHFNMNIGANLKADHKVD